MKSMKCKQCPKVIEGYSDRHIEYMMMQHMLKHKMEGKK